MIKQAMKKTLKESLPKLLYKERFIDFNDLDNINDGCKEERRTSSFLNYKDKRSYYIKLITLGLLSCLFIFLLLTFNNPVPITSKVFKVVVRKRLVSIIAMIIAAVCQSISTITFQSLTNNKIITPSLLGFEALYTSINTSIIFFFGSNFLLQFSDRGAFVINIMVMLIFSMLLYGLILSSKHINLHMMLLIGVVIGTLLRSLSSFMRKVLSPSEFDILQAKLFGSVNNAKEIYFIIAVPVVIITMILLNRFSKKLNILSQGKEIAQSLGIDSNKNLIYGLVLVSILMSISTALIGPLSFFGFLVAILTYQLVPTFNHKYLYTMAITLGIFIITSSYFIMNHIYKAGGAVSIIIEMVGGLVFLIVLLRKGTL